jgi:shikimate kinase
MGKLFDEIDTVVLLSAPLDTLMDRLAARTTGGYGHTTEERQKVAELVATIEPLLRRSDHYEIDTARPIGKTVEDILALVRSS